MRKRIDIHGSPWTKKDFRVVLKRFYKWLKGGGEEYPPEVSWIKTTLRARDQLLPEELLTEDEVKRLVDAATSPRDKAFVILLYESGARIGELGAMRIRDVAFEQGYARIMLRGKTGARQVIVVASMPYLADWIQHHPLRDDPDAPLWVNLGTVNRLEPMSYPALAKVLKTVAEKAGLKKRVHPHVLRHSRATFLARRLTEAQMSQMFGWKQGSRMPSIYVHLSGRDLEDALLGIYGLRKPEGEKPELAPRVCPRCSESNQFDARFCSKCGMVLDLKAAVQLEEMRARADELMSKLIQDPEVQAVLLKKIKELGLA